MAFWGALFRVMATTRTRRIGRREAEELLSGKRTAADRDALIRLLDLAAAPPAPQELAGREATVRALVQTYQDAARATRTPRRSPVSMLSKAIAVKVFAGVIVLLLGGAAVAATTGNLPTPVQQGAHDLLSPLGVVVPAGKTPQPPKDNGGTRRPAPQPSRTMRHSPTAGPSTDPAVLGLCQAWDAHQKRTDRPGKAMDAAAFQALAAAAGGAEKIAAYCATVLGAQTSTTSPPPLKDRSSRPSRAPRKLAVRVPRTLGYQGGHPGQPTANRQR